MPLIVKLLLATAASKLPGGAQRFDFLKQFRIQTTIVV